MLSSVVCRYEHFTTAWYDRWSTEIAKKALWGPRPHRKIWEYCAVAQALDERGLLKPGKKGLGFAVGREPMASLFAKYGCSVVASDRRAAEGTSTEWDMTNQHAASIEALYDPEVVTREKFDANVQFQTIDMSAPMPYPPQSFDFLWSCCAFEHLGSLNAGWQFLQNSSRLLKPGGVAVHTTEFNVSSNIKTVDVGGSVLYRQQDIEQIGALLRFDELVLERPDFWAGDHEYDIFYDKPPYYQEPGRMHVKLLLEGYVSTSFLCIIRSPARAALPV